MPPLGRGGRRRKHCLPGTHSTSPCTQSPLRDFYSSALRAVWSLPPLYYHQCWQHFIPSFVGITSQGTRQWEAEKREFSSILSVVICWWILIHLITKPLKISLKVLSACQHFPSGYCPEHLCDSSYPAGLQQRLRPPVSGCAPAEAAKAGTSELALKHTTLSLLVTEPFPLKDTDLKGPNYPSGLCFLTCVILSFCCQRLLGR